MKYIGLDVHKRIVVVCALDASGQVLFRESFPMTREDLLAFAKKHLTAEDHIALEATTNCWAVVGVLAPLVKRVVVSNPVATKAIAWARVKTDKIDAHVLAQLLRCDFLPSVWVPDAQTRELRSLATLRAGLVAERTRLKNRIHAVLAERLMPTEGVIQDGKIDLNYLKTVSLDDVGRLTMDIHLRRLDAVEEDVKRLDQELAKRGYSDERIKLLVTIPGVYVAVAESVVAALGDVNRFESADRAASYLGLVPRTSASGEKSYNGPITKAGRSHTRWMLIQAAQHVAKNPGPLGAFFKKIAKKKNRNIAVVAVARKLVVVAWHMLKNNEPYRYAEPRPTAAKLRRLRIAGSGERRKTGVPKGTKTTSKLADGAHARTIPSIDEVYKREGLPALKPPMPPERRALKQAGVLDHCDAIHQEHVVPDSIKKKA